jgi:hypothetical protein
MTLTHSNGGISSSEAASGSDGRFGLVLDFFASELRLRGDAPVIQPHEKQGDVLCWNGEVSMRNLI